MFATVVSMYGHPRRIDALYVTRLLLVKKNLKNVDSECLKRWSATVDSVVEEREATTVRLSWALPPKHASN